MRLPDWARARAKRAAILSVVGTAIAVGVLAHQDATGLPENLHRAWWVVALCASIGILGLLPLKN